MTCATFYDPETISWYGPAEDYDVTRPVGDVLLASLLSQGDKTIQIFHDTNEHMTALDMYRRSQKIASILNQHITKGDIVSVCLRNEPNTAPIIVALFALGACINIIDQNNLTKSENENSFLQKITPKLIICHAEIIDFVNENLSNLQISPKVITYEKNNSTTFLAIETILEIDIDTSEFQPSIIADAENTIALILSTSGTTGIPKAACLSHSMLLSLIHRNTHQVNTGIAYNPNQLHWITAIEGLIGSIIRGTIRVISSLPPTASNMIDIVEKHNVTDIFSIPSRMYEIYKLLSTRRRQLINLRNVFSGGALVSEDIRAAMQQCCPNSNVSARYGLSEIGSIAMAMHGKRGNSVGHLLRGVRVKILNENGEKMGPSKIGAIHLKANHMFLGYYSSDGGLSKENQDNEGWFCPDDMGYFDEDGYLFIVGRKQDLLKFNHQIINPVDIERVIETHIGIERACVVGVSGSEFKDMPTALCIKSRDSSLTAIELKKWLTGKLSDKQQLVGGIYFIDALPETANGKVKKVVCREIAFRLYHENKANDNKCLTAYGLCLILLARR